MTDTIIPTRYSADHVVVRPGSDGDVWLRAVCLTRAQVAALVAALQGRHVPEPLSRDEEAAARADHEHDQARDDAL